MKSEKPKRSNYGLLLIALLAALTSGAISMAFRRSFANLGTISFLIYAAFYFFYLFLWGKATTFADKMEAAVLFILCIPMWVILSLGAFMDHDK